MDGRKISDQIELQLGDDPIKSYRAPGPGPFELFRMVLARIATICVHAPTWEWKDVPTDQMPTSFLSLRTHLINRNDHEPKYYRLEQDTLGNSPYECHSTIVVCTATCPETFLALDVINHPDRQFLIGKVVNKP